VIFKVLPAAGGTGGVITLDAQGQISMPFNTEGMYRGYVVADREPVVRIYE
jgi:beta-aspartyl-peptidase (threonine type)